MVTNSQLLLSIGIPSLMIVLLGVLDNLWFNRLDRRLDAVDVRFRSIENTIRDFRAEHRQDVAAVRAVPKLFHKP